MERGYKITDETGLLKLSQLIRDGQTFENCYVYLARDLDMASVDSFLPIGYVDFEVVEQGEGGIAKCTLGTAHPFRGFFNGHGHVIDNLVINLSSETVLYAGLFGLTDGAVISNLVLGEGCSVTHTCPNSYAAAGGLIGKSVNTTVENVLVATDVTTEGPHAAGFYGRGAATVRNSTNLGDMTATNSVAGIGGYNEGMTTIENCRNVGTMNGNIAAGIVSRLRGSVTVKNCINNGVINGNEVACGIGGLADRIDGTRKFEDCINYGALNAMAQSAVIGDVCISNPQQDGIDIPAPIVNNCQNLYNAERPVEDPTYEEMTIVCNPRQEVDGVGDGETAYVTTQEAEEFRQEIGVNQNPTGDEIGYSSARIEEVNMRNMVNIKNFEDYPDEDCYKLTDAEGLLELDRLLYNYFTFSTVTIYLAYDIDMSEISGFAPISYDIEHIKQVNGTPKYYFDGTIDGQGEAICNLVMHSTEEPLRFDAEGKVDIENGSIVPEAFVGVGLFGCAGGTYRNLIFDETCRFSYTGNATNPCASALLAKNHGTVEIDNVWNRASVSGGRFVGGLCGRMTNEYVIKNVTNSGDITGASCVGGLIGYDGTGGRIENCRNVGTVSRPGTGTSFHMASAGFVGRARGGIEMLGCINDGNINGAANVGAFLGTIMANSTMEDCINYGTLTAAVVPEAVGVEFATHETALEEDGTTVKLLGNVEARNVLDKAGTQDPTLLYETYLTYFYDPGDGCPGPGTTVTSATVATTEESGQNDTQETALSTEFTTVVVVCPTEKREDNAPKEPYEEPGCSSTVIGSMAVMLLICGAGWMILKKKED